MKLTFLSFSDYKGGASIGYEIFKSLKSKKSSLTVYSKYNKSKEIYNFLKNLYFDFKSKKIINIFLCKKISSIIIFNTFSK